jgi:hypothetical protein
MTASQYPKPYHQPRNLDQDAWFLYQTASLPYYELCARRCEEFAAFYKQLLGGKFSSEWISDSIKHAQRIYGGIDSIRKGGDQAQMKQILRDATNVTYGNPYNWQQETEEEKAWKERWKPCEQRMTIACSLGARTLGNATEAGLYWLGRGGYRDEPETHEQIKNRDDSYKGDLANDIQFAVEHEALTPPATYPQHTVDTHLSAKPGEPCPRSGVWVPSQWLQGARDFSLAFCIKGHLMQPAYQLFWDEPRLMLGESLKEKFLRDGIPLDNFYSAPPLETRALDTTWYFLAQPAAPTETPVLPNLLHCDAGELCPKSGYWTTQTKAHSRLYFAAGAVMPKAASDASSTRWQWDIEQTAKTRPG